MAALTKSPLTPLVSVLLPVHNAGRYLAESFASLEAQTLRSFEVIAVDDGSTDGSGEWLEAQARRSSWLKVFREPAAGVAASLNRGWAECRGAFVARMDADDIAHVRRLERQVEFLLSKPTIAVCGSWVKTFGASSQLWRYPVEDAAIRARLIFDSPFAHPAVMFRRSAVEIENPVYRASYRRAQDYDLWERLQSRCTFANLPEVLLRYRIHEAQATVVDRRAMLTSAAEVRSRILGKWRPESSAEDQVWHHEMCAGLLPTTPANFARAENWLLRLNDHHRRAPLVCGRVWQHTIAMKWWEVCRHFSSLGANPLVRFARSPLRQGASVSAPQWFRLMAGALRSVSRKKVMR